MSSKAKTDSSESGSLEQFIVAFNQREAEENLFARCKDEVNFPWWDSVRYSVQFSIAMEKGIVGGRREVPASKFARVANFIKHIVALVQFAWRLAFTNLQKADTLYVSTRNPHKASTPLLEGACQVLYVNKTGIINAPHQAFSKVTIDFLIRMIARFFSVPSEVALEISRIAADMKETFDVELNLQNIMLQKYKESQASFWIWGVVLKRLPSLKQMLFVNDDTLRPLVALTREKGLESIEMQHGYMGKSHFAYSYPDLPFALPTLPDKILVTRDTGDITFPVTQLKAEKMVPSASEAIRTIDVLIGGSPTRSQEMRDIVGALAESGLSIAVKLHPAQTEESSGLRPLFSAQSVTIFDGGEGFDSLVSRSHIYIPANPTSTTVFEAVEAGADLIIVNFAGQKLTNMCDDIATAEVNSLDRLHDTVINHLKRRQV